MGTLQVKLLSAQLATMQELQEQNQKHASENDELRSQLQEKQGEIEALRVRPVCNPQTNSSPHTTPFCTSLECQRTPF